MSKKFELGKVVVTAAVHNTCNGPYGKHFYTFLRVSLGRYCNCDWGDTCEADKHQNDAAVRTGERILAVYKFNDELTIWIITEWDRSTTTILFPSDY